MVTAAEAIDDGNSVSMRKATRTFVEGDSLDLTSGKSRRDKLLAIGNHQTHLFFFVFQFFLRYIIRNKFWE